MDDTTIDFAIRPGVRFQNGDPLTADDVVYTVWCATHEPVAVPSNYAYLAGAEAIDPMTVRIRLSRVFPAALEYLAMTLPIYPKAYRERVGAEAYAKSPIGAGPYRITWIDPAGGEAGGGVRLDRYDGYYDGSPKGRPAIAHVAIRQVADADAELDDLLAGRADWIWDFKPERFDEVLRVPTLQALRAETMRVAYMSLGRRRPHRPRRTADETPRAPGDLSRDRPRRHRAQRDAGRLPHLGRALLPDAVRLQPGDRGQVRLRPPRRRGGCWPRPATTRASGSSSSRYALPAMADAVREDLKGRRRGRDGRPARHRRRGAPLGRGGGRRCRWAAGAAIPSTTCRRSCRSSSPAAATTTPATRRSRDWCWRAGSRPTRTSAARTIPTRSAASPSRRTGCRCSPT